MPMVTESIRPHETRSDRFKGSFALLHDTDPESPTYEQELCIGCLACERICPSQIITVTRGPKIEKTDGKKRGTASDFTLDLQACIYCELCIQVCPTDAIIFVRVQEKPGFSREDLVLTMDKLYANEKLQPHYWGTGSKLMEMQNPKKEAS